MRCLSPPTRRYRKNALPLQGARRFQSLAILPTDNSGGEATRLSGWFFFQTEVPNGLDLFPKHMLSGGAPQVEIDAQDAAFVERNLTSLTSGAKACLWRCIRTEYGTCCENQTAPAQLLFSRESTTDPRSIRR
jgi:hypothetical protein